MFRVFSFLIAAASLSACANEVSVPATGRIGTELAQGAATARLSGEGSFFAMTPRGLRCEGTYDSLTTEPTLSVPIRCNDGRTGNLIITRQLNGISGTAIGRLSDGTLGQFVFGDLTFDQAFGGSGASTR